MTLECPLSFIIRISVGMFEKHCFRALRKKKADGGGYMHLKENPGISLVAQWLRIHLPVQGTQVGSLVREDPTCCLAAKPVCHNY